MGLTFISSMDSTPLHPLHSKCHRRNNRIQLFDAHSRCFLASCGEKGQITPGLLAAPEGIAFVEGRPEVHRSESQENSITFLDDSLFQIQLSVDLMETRCSLQSTHKISS